MACSSGELKIARGEKDRGDFKEACVNDSGVRSQGEAGLDGDDRKTRSSRSRETRG